jgi:hypothetical protein
MAFGDRGGHRGGRAEAEHEQRPERTEPAAEPTEHAGCEEQVDLAVSDFPAPPDDTSPALLARAH